MFKTTSVKHEIDIEGFNSIQYFEFGNDFTHPPEEHDFWEMVYVDKGYINAVTNNVGYFLRQGQVVFHEPHEMHAHVSDARVSNNMLVVTFTTKSEAMKHLKGKAFSLGKTPKGLLTLFMQEAKDALGGMPNDYNDTKNLKFSPQTFGAEQMLECYFIEFLINLIRNEELISKKILSNQQSREAASNSLCGLIMQYMMDNLHTNITQKDICDKFLIGKTQLCKIFIDNTSCSPMKYYMSLKIAEAKRLLKDKRASISQISEILAYSSVHNFSRAFKKETGFTPTEYSKSIT